MITIFRYALILVRSRRFSLTPVHFQAALRGVVRALHPALAGVVPATMGAAMEEIGGTATMGAAMEEIGGTATMGAAMDEIGGTTMRHHPHGGTRQATPANEAA